MFWPCSMCLMMISDCGEDSLHICIKIQERPTTAGFGKHSSYLPCPQGHQFVRAAKWERGAPGFTIHPTQCRLKGYFCATKGCHRALCRYPKLENCANAVEIFDACHWAASNDVGSIQHVWNFETTDTPVTIVSDNGFSFLLVCSRNFLPLLRCTMVSAERVCIMQCRQLWLWTGSGTHLLTTAYFYIVRNISSWSGTWSW